MLIQPVSTVRVCANDYFGAVGEVEALIHGLSRMAIIDSSPDA
jgi:hypothetical protein